MSSTSREDFEAWAARKRMNLSTAHDGDYVFQPAFYAWLGWSAGRRAMIQQASASLGRKGGQSRSLNKAQAARENGKLGGRPRKKFSP